MRPTLVLISGLPGTGKTRLANELARRVGIPVFARDRFQSQLRQLGLSDRDGPAGYRLLLDLADQQLSLGVGAILEAVFPKPGYREVARKIADHHRAEFKPVLCYCSSDAVLKERMEDRAQYVPHWTPVGWDELLRIRAHFAPWEDDSALPLDAVDDFKQNLSRALWWVADEDGVDSEAGTRVKA